MSGGRARNKMVNERVWRRWRRGRKGEGSLRGGHLQRLGKEGGEHQENEKFRNANKVIRMRVEE